MIRNVLPTFVLLVSALPLWAVDNGMVLLMREVPSGTVTGSTVELHYLSSGKSVLLENGSANGAAFSPDGRKVAYFHCVEDRWGSRKKELYTVNIDGTGRTKLHTGVINNTSNYAQWCTDGYIYWSMWDSGDKIMRCPENGGEVTVAHDMVGMVDAPIGGKVDEGTGSFQMCADGTKSVSTTQYYDAEGNKSGWAQLAIKLDTHEEFTPWRPCHGAISPNGQVISVSDHGHKVYRFAKWPNPYVVYGPDGAWGNTYDGCSAGRLEYENEVCPDYDTVIWIGYHLRDSFEMEDLVGVVNPRFSNSDNDIFVFSSTNPGDERSGGAWIYEFPNKGYTKVGPLGTWVWDYYRTEITPDRDYSLAPCFTVFYIDSTGTLPPTKTVTLSSAQDMPGAPTISGAPDWLIVNPIRVSAREYSLECTILAAALPDTGTYPDTVEVTPAGSAQPLTFIPTLVVESHPDMPIVISNPVAGQTYRIGDTLRVEYSADSILIPGTLISLSVDAGDTWWQMHDDASYETGANQVLEYVIPDVVGGSHNTISDQCLVMISNYPEGHETFSGVFSITDSTSTISGQGHDQPPIAHRVLRVNAKRSASSTLLDIASPEAGVARLLNVQGRTARSFKLARGLQTVGLSSLQAGRYLLEISYAGGVRKTIVVDAF